MDSDEDLVTYGTPLPDLGEDEVLRKRSAQDIQVKDEKGRQRFHGAFTGGFSAGYFNTVGTKEGWAPATFISTRDRSKSTRIEQNPEDFMDEEDFNEFGIAPKKIRTTSNFQDETSSSTRKRKFISNSDVAIPGEPPLRDIIKPVVESIGIIILKRMGWRQGQGIGPRVKKRTKKDVKTYGCSPGPLELEEEDPMLNRFTLAPEDTPAIPYIPKDDLHGIGYSGLSTISVLSDPSDKLSSSATKSWIAKDKKKLAISGQAFGVGAFEDDDDDIYTQDDMTQYDFSEFAGNKRDESSKNSTGSKNKSTYGVLVLEGFCIATRPKSAKQHYPPPQLPLDFRPVYKRASRFSDASSSKEKSRHKLTADERSKLLGEKKFVRTDNNAGNVPEMSSKSDETHKHAPVLSIKLTDTYNFKPFVKDDPKQKRYEEYLKLRDNQDHFKLIQPSSMTEWEKQQEIEEFAESASLFRPMSKALSSRFESRSHLGIEHDVMRELQDLKKEKEEASPLTIKKGPIEPKRETFEWHPVSLLCRRFNVPNPYPESTSEGVPCAQKVKLSIFDCLSIGEEILKDEQSVDEPETSVARPIKEISEIKTEIEEPRVKDTLTETAETDNLNTEGVAKENSRPPMDLFKDIFQNTSSEESDDSDQEKAKNSATPLSPKLDTIKQEVVELCNNENKPTTSNNVAKTPAASTMKGAFGVFANLDLDALNKRTLVSKKTFSETREVLQKQDVAKISAPNLEKEIIDVEATTSNVSLPTEDYYGPALPPSGITAVSPEASSQRVPHKHYKHKHKSKHHKHKVKKRKKEKKKHSKKDLEESSDYSVNSDEEISSSIILEKLKKLQYKERTKK